MIPRTIQTQVIPRNFHFNSAQLFKSQLKFNRLHRKHLYKSERKPNLRNPSGFTSPPNTQYKFISPKLGKVGSSGGHAGAATQTAPAANPGLHIQIRASFVCWYRGSVPISDQVLIIYLYKKGV